MWNISMAIFTLYMYSIRKVIMYNCHLDTQPGDLGPFKGCYSVTSTERSFSPRSKKRLETSKHPLNGGSGIFLFELIGINLGINMIEKVRQTLSPKIKQVGYRRSKCRWITYLTWAWRHTFTKSDRRWEDLSTDVNECWLHRIWSTSFRLVVTWLTERTYASTDCTGGVGETIKGKGGVSQACLGKSTSMLWSIDSFQNRVSADKYHLTVSRAQVSTNRDQVFFCSYRWQVTSFQIIAGSSLIFLNWYEIFCVYVPHD